MPSCWARASLPPGRTSPSRRRWGLRRVGALPRAAQAGDGRSHVPTAQLTQAPVTFSAWPAIPAGCAPHGLPRLPGQPAQAGRGAGLQPCGGGAAPAGLRGARAQVRAQAGRSALQCKAVPCSARLRMGIHRGSRGRRPLGAAASEEACISPHSRPPSPRTLQHGLPAATPPPQTRSACLTTRAISRVGTMAAQRRLTSE